MLLLCTILCNSIMHTCTIETSRSICVYIRLSSIYHVWSDWFTYITLLLIFTVFGPPTGVHSKGITDDFSVTISWNSATTNSSKLSHYTVTLVWTRPVIFNMPSTLSDTDTRVIPISDRENSYTHTFHGIQAYSHNCLTVEAVYSQDDTVLATIAAPTQCFNSSSSGKYTSYNLHMCFEFAYL